MDRWGGLLVRMLYFEPRFLPPHTAWQLYRSCSLSCDAALNTRLQIEHKRLKVQHKKDKERDRYVTAPSPRMMQAAAGPGGRVQQPQHFRQPLLPQHTSALRHHSVRIFFFFLKALVESSTSHLCEGYFHGKLYSCRMANS